MTISKTLSTLSLASAMVAAAVAQSPSDAAAGGFKSQTKDTAKVGGGHPKPPAKVVRH